MRWTRAAAVCTRTCRSRTSSSSGSSFLSDRLIDPGPVYLIADLHLEAGRPETTRLLLDFLRGPARRARALYILGDLFEVWIGDDGADDLADAVAADLRRLADSGIAVRFLPGNRDFLLGDAYCARAGMQPCREPLMLETNGPATALMHGDTLCTDDLDYQRFRAKVRDPAWQERMLSRPLWWRRVLARLARAISRARNRGASPEIMDVNAGTVVQCFQDLSIRRLIHGHTHRPGIHQFEINGESCHRIVLGDWHGETGSVCEVTGEQARLLRLRRRADGALQLEAV
ncbi:MAG: UDP-2,3-diacylglucosamine diphosphatase [Wenzhouxiangella sp.]